MSAAPLDFAGTSEGDIRDDDIEDFIYNAEPIPVADAADAAATTDRLYSGNAGGP